MKTAAVTGASGFLGRNVVRQLLADGYQVTALVRNASTARSLVPPQAEVREYCLQSPASVQNAIANHQVVVHCAAVHNRKIGGRQELIDINVQGTENVLAALSADQQMVFIGSIRSMMNKHRAVADENTPYEFAEYDSPYGHSKYAAEQLCLTYAQKGKRVYILNPAVILGPEDYGPSHNGAMILRHLRSALVPFTQAVWSIADVRDVARAIPFVMERGRIGERHVVCSAQFGLRDFFRMIDAASGQRKLYVPVPHVVLWLAGALLELVEKMVPSFEPAITRSGAKAARLGIGFSGAKLNAMGFTYTDPRVTVRDTAEWFLKPDMTDKGNE